MLSLDLRIINKERSQAVYVIVDILFNTEYHSVSFIRPVQPLETLQCIHEGMI